jgi:hypothetical protein
MHRAWRQAEYPVRVVTARVPRRTAERAYPGARRPPGLGAAHAREGSSSKRTFAFWGYPRSCAESRNQCYRRIVVAVPRSRLPPGVLDGCRRVLQSGCRIALVALSRQPGVTISLYEWGHAVLPRYLDCCPIRPDEVLEQPDWRCTLAAC